MTSSRDEVGSDAPRECLSGRWLRAEGSETGAFLSAACPSRELAHEFMVWIGHTQSKSQVNVIIYAYVYAAKL